MDIFEKDDTEMYRLVEDNKNYYCSLSEGNVVQINEQCYQQVEGESQISFCLLPQKVARFFYRKIKTEKTFNQLYFGDTANRSWYEKMVEKLNYWEKRRLLTLWRAVEAQPFELISSRYYRDCQRPNGHWRYTEVVRLRSRDVIYEVLINPKGHVKSVSSPDEQAEKKAAREYGQKAKNLADRACVPWKIAQSLKNLDDKDAVKVLIRLRKKRKVADRNKLLEGGRPELVAFLENDYLHFRETAVWRLIKYLCKEDV